MQLSCGTAVGGTDGLDVMVNGGVVGMGEG
jgi:hypothetical protein